uniref:Uncharacterized protein n=1 Tax=Anguilla anguilla TaxID=7936 RepID=A0A0E9WMK9_ANGAN
MSLNLLTSVKRVLMNLHFNKPRNSSALSSRTLYMTSYTSSLSSQGVYYSCSYIRRDN